MELLIIVGGLVLITPAIATFMMPFNIWAMKNSSIKQETLLNNIYRSNLRLEKLLDKEEL